MSDDSVLENADTAELLDNIDIEETLQPENLRELLDQLNLESVLGGFGAAVGSGVGAVVGRKVGAALGSTEGETTDETAGDEDPDIPESREELEELSYRELQSLTTDTDVQGNLPREEMTEQLAEEFGLESE